MSRPSVPPAGNLQILAGDLLCHHANELLRQLACGSWAPAQALRDAISMYSDVRLGAALAEGADALIAHVSSKYDSDEKAPDTLRSAPHVAIDQVEGVDES